MATSSSRKNGSGSTKATGRKKARTPDKANGKAASRTVERPRDQDDKTRYEALIYHKSDKRQGEIQRLGFHGPAKFSLAVKKAKELIKSLIQVGGFERGDMLLMGVVRSQYFDRWYEFNVKKTKENRQQMQKQAEAVLKKPTGKKGKTIKPITWVGVDGKAANPKANADIFKTRG